MITWVLILWLRGTWSSESPSSLATVPGFTKIEECQEAGRQANGMTRGVYSMEVRWTCVKQTTSEKPVAEKP